MLHQIGSELIHCYDARPFLTDLVASNHLIEPSDHRHSLIAQRTLSS
jgi:hypothetical protein